ncbi:MAG: signal peptidase I [Actinomycetota bacterium]|jgi:signal peptidase I|nr:signal peptidase I [Actinomycetota bacterium]
MSPFGRVLEADRGHGNRIASKIFLPLLIVLIALLVLFFGVYWTGEVSGDSMLPGLMNADLMLLTRGYEQPARGDVVIIDSVTYQTNEESIVKRVIGLAGDEVQLSDGRAVVNGVPESGYETLQYGGMFGGDANIPAITVPEGHIYVLGDNRPVSLDSRALGPITLEHVRGRAVFVFAPINHIGPID